MIISAIYKIQSIIKPERIYIGSAKNISERWRLHLVHLRKNTHHSKKLQNHFNKHGETDLQFTILLGCEINDLLKTEQYFIDSYRPWFNMSPTAGSCLGCKRPGMTSPNKGKRASMESRAKMSESQKKRVHKKGFKHSPETCEKMRLFHTGRISPSKGKKWSDESRKKCSERMSGINNPFYGKSHTEETKQKISGSNAGKVRSDETKKKLSIEFSGPGNPFYGKKHSAETLMKLRMPRNKKSA